MTKLSFSFGPLIPQLGGTRDRITACPDGGSPVLTVQAFRTGAVMGGKLAHSAMLACCCSFPFEDDVGWER